MGCGQCVPFLPSPLTVTLTLLIHSSPVTQRPSGSQDLLRGCVGRGVCSTGRVLSPPPGPVGPASAQDPQIGPWGKQQGRALSWPRLVAGSWAPRHPAPFRLGQWPEEVSFLQGRWGQPSSSFPVHCEAHLLSGPLGGMEPRPTCASSSVPCTQGPS